MAATAVLAATGLLAAGCAEPGRIIVDQPFAPPSQKRLVLEPAGAWYSTQGVRQACVLTFNLPRARNGPRAFVLYLSGPPGGGEVGSAEERAATVRGFLVQEVGQLAGRTVFTGGRAEIAPVSLAPELRDLRLDVRCDDGSHVTGTARLLPSPADVKAIERQFAADVARLTEGAPTEAPPAPPAESGTP